MVWGHAVSERAALLRQRKTQNRWIHQPVQIAAFHKILTHSILVGALSKGKDVYSGIYILYTKSRQVRVVAEEGAYSIVGRCACV